MSRAHGVALIDQLKYLLFRGDEVFSQSLNLDLLVFVFQDSQYLVVVEQVVNFTSVNFVHGDSHGEVSLVILPVVDTPLEQVLDCIVLKALHRECLA